MEYSDISTDALDCYQSIFTALETELLQVDQFFAEPKFSDSVPTSDTFSLHKCFNGEALASNFLQGERAENGLLAGTLEQTTEELTDVVDSFQDLCEDYLLDIINDETGIPHKQKIDTTHYYDGEEEIASKTTGELNPLARIFKFKTKPRARNLKRGKPATYDYLTSFCEVSNFVFGWHKPKRYKDESLEYNLRNRMRNYGSFGAVSDELQDDVNGGTRTTKGNSGRRKRHKSWSIPEVLKLVEGVSQHGVGKWTKIKRLFFSASPHRSSVDLKDKWRNLLRASCKSACAKGRDEWVQGSASPTIPHDILSQVRELSLTHPYPRKQRRKII
ncbi:hypothetical protein L6452_24139 [Arctium lappa]|uniref:Uncharacterized protein n=1 Tax=Arctium lappa TaxID=4217 RepID=A0ACB9AAN2_ARCLA|nr:hypothetical protein L6452_24139 [Arctium lappa]